MNKTAGFNNMGLRHVQQTDSADMREFFPNHIIFLNLWPLEPGSTTIAYNLFLDFLYFREIAKATISFVISVCLSVRPSVRHYGTTQILPDGFSCNSIFEDFSKICRGTTSFIKM